jgi:hypothetical protein
VPKFRSCFVQDVVHSEHFRVVTPNWDGTDICTLRLQKMFITLKRRLETFAYAT